MLFPKNNQHKYLLVMMQQHLNLLNLLLNSSKMQAAPDFGAAFNIKQLSPVNFCLGDDNVNF